MEKTWYNSYTLSNGVVTWVEFREELCKRFGMVLMEDIVEELNKLVQTCIINEFLAKFEDLKAQMILKNLALDEFHFLSNFIGALKEEIKYAVKMFKPTTLSHAIEQARMQENAIKVVQRKNKTHAKCHQSQQAW